MKFKDIIFFSFHDLVRRKGRTFLTSLGIVIGTILILLLVSLGIMFNRFLISTISNSSYNTIINVQPIKYGSTNEAANIITNKTLTEIKNLKNVENISTRISTDIGDIKYNGKDYYSVYPIEGVNLNYSVYLENDISQGAKLANKKDFNPIIAGKMLNENNGNEVLVGEYLLPLLNVKNPKDIIGKDITLNVSNINGIPVKPYNEKLEVAGVISKYMNNARFVVMNDSNAANIIGYLQNTPNFMSRYGYNSVIVKVKNINDLSTVQNEINQLGYVATSNQSTAKNITATFNKIGTVLAMLGIIVIIVAAIGIINTMSMTVMERKKHIGIMKAVGANSNDIKKMFIVESAVIGLIGSIIGTLVSLGVYKMIALIISNIYMRNIQGVSLMSSIPLWLIGITIVFAVIISAFAGYYPAKKAASLDPIESIRG
ncbi:MAG: ABC transporter permease [Sarcina sp.]